MKYIDWSVYTVNITYSSDQCCCVVTNIDYSSWQYTGKVTLKRGMLCILGKDEATRESGVKMG